MHKTDVEYNAKTADFLETTIDSRVTPLQKRYLIISAVWFAEKFIKN